MMVCMVVFLSQTKHSWNSHHFFLLFILFLTVVPILLFNALFNLTLAPRFPKLFTKQVFVRFSSSQSRITKNPTEFDIIYLFTGYEDDIKLIVYRDSNYFRGKVKGNSCCQGGQ